MKTLKFSAMIFLAVLLMSNSGCEIEKTPKSSSGVTKADAKVKTQSNGLTIEQDNVKRRLEVENIPGSIKHLYVISSMSGQVLIYSTVKGKVTSSGKRLTPSNVQDGTYGAFGLDIGGKRVYTDEVLSDDGTYGSSIPYLFWWDVQGRYHQHYVSGGQILHVSDQPIPVKNITINLEAQ